MSVFLYLYFCVREGDNQMPTELWKWLPWSTVQEREQSKKHSTYHAHTSTQKILTSTTHSRKQLILAFWIWDCYLGSNYDLLLFQCSNDDQMYFHLLTKYQQPYCKNRSRSIISSSIICKCHNNGDSCPLLWKYNVYSIFVCFTALFSPQWGKLESTRAIFPIL